MPRHLTRRELLQRAGSGAGVLGLAASNSPPRNSATRSAATRPRWVGSVTTSQGTVTTGNTAGDTDVAVAVGTIAAGVAKAKADLVLVSGHDGGPRD